MTEPNTKNMTESLTKSPTESPTESIIGPTPLLNASGCMCDTKTKLTILFSDSLASGICSKSATPKHRAGNPVPRYWEAPDGQLTINSMGLPNLGIEYYLDYFKSLGHPVEGGKWRCVSLAGLTLEDNLVMLRLVYDPAMTYYQYIDAVEWNLSCPNLSGHGILAYDFPEMDSYLQRLEAEIRCLATPSHHSSALTHILKLPPYFEPHQFTQVAAIIRKYPVFTAVNTVNSIPNGLVVDPYTETTVIHPKNGFGGIGGSVIKPTALANVRGLYMAFNNPESPTVQQKMIIIGTGGITCGLDVFEFILCGADLVSIGSQLMIEGAGCFVRINQELVDLMHDKAYTGLEDFRGKLKTAPGRC